MLRGCGLEAGRLAPWVSLGSRLELAQPPMGNAVDDSKQPWKSPLLWPPSTWRLNRAQQFFADAAATLTIFGLLVIAIAAAFALYVIPYKAMAALFLGKDESVRNYLLGLGALLGVPFLVWRTIIASRQTAISRETLYTQLFTSGVERLGAEKVVKKIDSRAVYKKIGDNLERDENNFPIQDFDHKGMPLFDNKTIESTEINLEVRLGAVYALERVALDSYRDKTAIMKTLAAYIRNSIKYSDKTEIGDIDARPDVYAAIGVLGNFPEKRKDAFTYDLTKINLRSMRIKDLKLESCDFSNSVSENMYCGSCSFEECGFHGASWIGLRAHSCNFNYASYYNSKIDRSHILKSSFENVTLLNSSAETISFDKTVILNSHFEKFESKNSLYSECLIENSYFSEGNMSNTRIINTKLSESVFNEVNLFAVEFIRSDLAGVKFTRCNLTGAKLPDGISVDLDENFIASDDWMNEQYQSQPIWEAVQYRVEQAWREWLREKR